MDEKPFYHRILFSPVFWGFFLLATYFFAMWRLGGFVVDSDARIFLIDLLLLIVAGLGWMFFFAQFILPVRTNENRFKIFGLLLKRVFLRKDGPALFIKNGFLVEKEGERDKKGAGVIVLDSASAAVLKKFKGYTRAVGPGVVFTEKGETIADEPVPLYTLSDLAGPQEQEDPFLSPDDVPSHEEYLAIQERRLQTSALTRDGIEIVPNITVAFKINADPAKGKESGSRFGYDEDAVWKAVWHNSINPTLVGDKSVKWMQLPILLAVDLWREYVGKYRFDELFKPTQPIPESSPDEPVVMPPKKNDPQKTDIGLRGIICDALKILNRLMEYIFRRIEERISPPIQEEEKAIKPQTKKIEEGKTVEKPQSDKETALQSISRYMNQRMKEEKYPLVDRYGQMTGEPLQKSAEYAFLQARGIRVLSVGVKNLRFNASLEEGLLKSWSTSWLKNAKDEEKEIDGQYKLSERRGREKALLAYANDLSRAVLREKPKTNRQALRVLVHATRKKIIRNPQLHKNAEKLIRDLTDFLQWIETGGDTDGS